jgi:predicted ATP-grasp superfamily ATP-dependent carboligase
VLLVPAVHAVTNCREQRTPCRSVAQLTQPLVIVGASARAAAMSARRSGFAPWAADLFADLDLQACCPTQWVDDYPTGIAAAIAKAPPGPWMYVGAFENHPDLIDRIAAERPLLGNQGAALRAVRDPFRLSEVLSRAGFSTPQILPTSAETPRDGNWLVKPFASAAGFRIRRWRGDDQATERPVDCYFQEFIDGESVGAVYVGNGGVAWLLGVTSQLIQAESSSSADAPFRYCGSIGPLILTAEHETQFNRLGHLLAAEFKLRGLFGVDVMLADGRIYPLEVNPRYTASVEILERSRGFPAIELHVAGCLGLESRLQAAMCFPSSLMAEFQQAAGKRIVYATVDSVAPARFSEWAADQNRDLNWPQMADIPAAGTMIPAGRPICTVLAAAADRARVAEQLNWLTRQVSDLIKPARLANHKAAGLS